MGFMFYCLLFYSSPFVFAAGININILITLIFLFGSGVIKQYSTNRIGNTAIDILLAIVLGILAGILISIYFGFFVFGLYLSHIAAESIEKPFMTSYITRKYSSNIMSIGFWFCVLSYCLALYDFLIK